MRPTSRSGPLVEELQALARGGPGHGVACRSAATAEDPDARELAALLDRAADLEPTAPAWRELAIDAGRVTAELADAGRIQRHLVVAATDPPVVAARLLMVAWRATCHPLRCRVSGRRRWASTTTADG